MVVVVMVEVQMQKEEVAQVRTKYHQRIESTKVPAIH